jgi:hypothetical protein
VAGDDDGAAVQMIGCCSIAYYSAIAGEKVKVSLSAMKAYGSGFIDPHFLDLGTSWR